MSTHNICFCVEIRKISVWKKKSENNTIPRAMTFMQFHQGLHCILAEELNVPYLF